VGSNNVALGARALYRSNSTTGGNIGVGACAGCDLTTGINNTIIGSLPGVAGCVCTLLIGAGTCERIRVDDTGLYINNVYWSSVGYFGSTGYTGSIGYTGSQGSFTGTTNQQVVITNTTTSTSTTTGALVVTGGVGVGGGMFVGGTVTAASITAQASAATTASTVASVGYMGLPQNATGTTTLTMSDAGKHIYVTTAGQTITIPAAASVAYPIGTTITFIAGASATTVLIAITTDTLRLAGGTSTGTRTLAANGIATAVKVSGTSSSGVWYINGTGLT